MKTSKIVRFPKVREAREALKAKAMEIYELQMKIITEAIAAGDYETAAKANQFLMEHLPDEDGTSLLNISVDKPKESGDKSGPTIQIGFALGGLPPPKGALPPAVIDVEPVEPSDKTEENGN
jgi:hypothetical protein